MMVKNHNIPSGDSNIAGKSQLRLAIEVSIMGKPLNLIWGVFRARHVWLLEANQPNDQNVGATLRHPWHGKPLGMPGIAQENMASWGVHKMSHWDKNTRLSLPHIPDYPSTTPCLLVLSLSCPHLGWNMVPWNFIANAPLPLNIAMFGHSMV